MARDRKRAKQRQQGGARASSRSGTAPTQPPPSPPDDDGRASADPLEHASADPLEHASADSDLAEVAERTGLPAEEFVGDQDGAVYDDEVTKDEEEPGEEASIRPARRRRGEPTVGGEVHRGRGHRLVHLPRGCVVAVWRGPLAGP